LPKGPVASPELRGWGAGYQRRNHGLEARGYTKSELGELQAPKARSCDCRRQEAPSD